MLCTLGSNRNAVVGAYVGRSRVAYRFRETGRGQILNTVLGHNMFYFPNMLRSHWRAFYRG